MSSTSQNKDTVSDICGKHINNYPHLKKFLRKFLKHTKVQITNIHNIFDYPYVVNKSNLARSYGIFMVYFVHKVLSFRYRVETKDDITEVILKDADIYFTTEMKNAILPKTIQEHYEIFKDLNKSALQVKESIKILALSPLIYFNEPLPTVELEVSDDNLHKILNYLERLPYETVDMRPNVDCVYFKGNADFIFDEKMIYEIRTANDQDIMPKDFVGQQFNTLILYAFGYYKKTGKIINQFTNYNALLAIEYKIDVNIDMIGLEEALKKDLQKVE